MYNAKTYKNNAFKKTVPLISFVSILLVSFLLSGSAKISHNSELAASDSPLGQIRISYRFNSVAISDILRKISLDYGVKIQSNIEINGRVSANLISSPLQEALAVILKDSAYSFKLGKDAIVIEKRRGGAFSAVSDRMGLKRVLIAPAFISGAEVRRVVDSLKTADAIVNYDEKSGVLVLDERPDAAERIINEINKLDTADADIISGGSNAQTKLFILKNINLKDCFGDIEKLLSSGGSAFPNYDLNSIIVTDKNEVIGGINHYISKLETENGVPVINCKFYKVPRAVINDLIGLGYYDAREIDLAELSFSIVKNKIHYLSILDKYLRHSSSMSCDSSDDTEMKILHKSINSKISIKPYINLNAGYSLKIGLQEDAQAFNETLRFKSQSYNFDISENDIIIAKGFEKSFIDVINQSSFRGFLSYMPALSNINETITSLAAESTTTAGEENAVSASEFILMAIELSTVKNNAGMAKYSFVNLLHLDSQNAYADYASGGNGSAGDNKSYLNIFSAPAGAENYSKMSNNSKEYDKIMQKSSLAETQSNTSAAADKNESAIFKIKSKNNANGNNGNNINNNSDGDKNLIIEDYQKKSAHALKLNKKTNGQFVDNSRSRNLNLPDENETLNEIKRLITAARYEQAKIAALKHLEAEPGSCRIRIALGSVYKEMKLYVSAQRELKTALKYDAKNKKLIDNIDKLHKLIALIRDEKNKLAGSIEAEELDMYLR